MPKTKDEAIDPQGEDTVLFYTGPTVVPNVPARDLHGNDIARIAYVRAHHATDWDARDAAGNGPALPKPATQHELSALAAELVDSGAYARSGSAAAATTQTTTTEPDAPAETPEG